MESRIPVPTDSIYKFCALFGLLVAVFSVGSMIYVNKTTNELAFSSWVEYEELKQIKTPNVSEAAKIKSLERRLEIAQADKKAFQSALSWMFALAWIPIVYGFWKWHSHLQPMQDELLQLQIKKLRRELNESKRLIPRR
jgi:hypothetical protein